MNQRPDAERTPAVPAAGQTTLPVLSEGPRLLAEPGGAGRGRRSRGDPRARPRPGRRRRRGWRRPAAATSSATWRPRWPWAASPAAPSSPPRQIVPYVEQPEQIVPGKPLFFATALATDGFALGVLVESQMGRPTKIEGNPDHPASLGATDAFAQAAILDFYDPDRSQVVTRDGRVETWVHFQEIFLGLRERMREAEGRRPEHPDAHVDLADPGRSAPPPARAVPPGEAPRLRARHSRRRRRRHEAGLRRGARAGLSPRQGRRDRRARRRFLLDGARAGSRNARAFAARREVEPEVLAFINGRAEQGGQAPGTPSMNRLYAIECTPTITGASADHRLAVAARDVDPIARAIARGVGAGVGQGADLPDHLARTRRLGRGARPRPHPDERPMRGHPRRDPARRRSTRWRT